jgi:hypothetical protein
MKKYRIHHIGKKIQKNPLVTEISRRARKKGWIGRGRMKGGRVVGVEAVGAEWEGDWIGVGDGLFSYSVKMYFFMPFRFVSFCIVT